MKPTNVTQLQAQIEAGNVEVLEGEAIPPTVQATLAEYEAKLAQPHIVYRLIQENKYGALLRCASCNDTSRLVRTSDLFQVSECQGCQAKTRKARAKARRAEAKAALEAAKGQKTSKK